MNHRLLLGALFAALAPNALADVVYDNLGPGDDYEPQVGWIVSDGPPFGNIVEQAMPFEPSASGPLGMIEFPMTMVGGSAQASISVDVYSDAPGEPLMSLSATSVTTTFAANPANPLAPLVTAAFPGSLSLNAGQRYWIVIANTTPLNGNFLVWNQNTTGATDDVADRRNGGNWNVFADENLAAFRVHTADGLGTTYCGPAAVNSTGSPGIVTATGSAVVSANSLTLVAEGLPANQFGIFLTSRTQAFVPGAGGTSNGNICLGGMIGRFALPSQILNSGGAGTFSFAADLTAFPQGSGFVPVAAGETWNFQAWYRDPVGLGSNFTDGVEIAFQ